MNARIVPNAYVRSALFALACVCPIRTSGESPVGEDSELPLVRMLEAFEMHGTVIDVTGDISDDGMAKLESVILANLTAAQASDAVRGNTAALSGDSEEIFMKTLDPVAVTGAYVKLQGDGVHEQAVTDSEGTFHFLGIPRGEYELCAEAPARHFKGTARGKIKFDFAPGGWLEPVVEIHAFPVRVTGRIISTDGHPVENAKVSASPVCLREKFRNHDSYHYEMLSNQMRQYEISTVSTTNGYYELTDFVPPHVYEIAAYLHSGTDALVDAAVPSSALSRFFVDIHVEAEGLAQRNVPRVPLVTEPLLSKARRLWKLMICASSDLTEEQRRNFKFEPKGWLPASEGTTIPNIEIVMEPVAGRSGERISAEPTGAVEEPAAR